ncbi:hypothetical protein Lepto7376_2546 [[Leptolyngbya] sp. PCC 7376]|nr:hypothetical protein Lepto7376_2546 [[Leptolyngbya] sp. PCC 7376]
MNPQLISTLQFTGIITVFCMIYAPLLSWILPTHG